MELEYLKTANSIWLWISAIPAVGLVIFQAVLFMKRAITDGKEMGITTEQMKIGAKSAFFASIGPSIAIVISMVGLLASIGAPVAWMRLSYIGSVMYELSAADRAATAAGAILGTSNMTMEAFANAVWVMSICSLGWILISALFTDKMGILRDKVASGNKAALGIMATAGGLGGMGYQAINRAIPEITPQTIAVIAGFLIMVIIRLYADKFNKAWAKQFGITIAMMGGMAIGAFFM